MTENEVRPKLGAVFCDIFDNDELRITDTTTAADVEGWDSLTHVNLVVAVEKAFKISFTTKEISALKNVGEFVRLIARKSP